MARGDLRLDEPQEHILAPFEPRPELHPNGNGSKVKRRRRPLRGTIFGVLAGALLATSFVPRLQWLNLHKIGWWGRPAICAAVAGAMVGAFRRDDGRLAIVAGGVAGLIALWGVYALVRISTPVLWVERSMWGTIAGDMGRLALWGLPAAIAGAGAAWWLRARAAGLRGARAR